MIVQEQELHRRLALPDRNPSLISDDAPIPPGPLTPAAVLVALRPASRISQGGVVLTRRTDRLRHHAGQVSFPGGRIEPDDASPEDAALREAFEEIGLPGDAVSLSGRLAPYVTGSGFAVTPVLGILARPFTPRPAPGEVAAVFDLPLDVLLDPAAPEERVVVHEGRERRFWVWPHPEHYIWGATAAILMRLAARLRHGGEAAT